MKITMMPVVYDDENNECRVGDTILVRTTRIPELSTSEQMKSWNANLTGKCVKRVSKRTYTHENGHHTVSVFSLHK